MVTLLQTVTDRQLNGLPLNNSFGILFVWCSFWSELTRGSLKDAAPTFKRRPIAHVQIYQNTDKRATLAWNLSRKKCLKMLMDLD